jgi:hypothetical protein
MAAPHRQPREYMLNTTPATVSFWPTSKLSQTDGVPVTAGQEFAKLYKEKVAALKPFVTMRIIMKHAYYVGAAHIADKLASGFPRGRYDDDVELIAASIASINGYRILTSTFQVTVYQGMECERPTSKLG